ncbi:hypothetical protein TNCV_2475061 [Trichonephila clavipes]|nr:hypothetical protein TNCV_2475061 [Trichonephila clavipes]
MDLPEPNDVVMADKGFLIEEELDKIARAKKVARFKETFPQAELRRLEQAEREAAHRVAETPEQYFNDPNFKIP